MAWFSPKLDGILKILLGQKVHILQAAAAAAIIYSLARYLGKGRLKNEDAISRPNVSWGHLCR